MDPLSSALTKDIPEWPTRITGVCDASAAIVRPNGSFIIADDETNILAEYDRAGTRTGPHEPPLDELLEAAGFKLERDKKNQPREIDIEGVAVLRTDAGAVAFWIGSHARRKAVWKNDGELKKPRLNKNRRVVFATNIPETGSPVLLKGVPATDLRDRVMSPPDEIKGVLHPLREAEKKEHRPNAGGWNIEGLAPGPDGSLLIGFRSPPDNDKRALIVSIRNPLKAIEGEPIELGDAVWLDLGTRGIRGMDWSPRLSAWLIIAGPVDYIHIETREPITGYATDFSVYKWEGFGEPAIELIWNPSNLRPDFRPEILIAAGDGFYLISDDGSVERPSGGTCKTIIKNEPEHPDVYVRARFFRYSEFAP